MQASAKTPLLSGKQQPSYAAEESKDGPAPLFPPHITFIADLLQDLQKQISNAHWKIICKNVYTDIFKIMDVLKISADGKISAWQDNQIQLDLQSLLAIIAEVRKNLATSCQGMKKEVIKKIAASLDELKQRLVKYVHNNFPNYAEKRNKKANEHATAIIRNARVAKLLKDLQKHISPAQLQIICKTVQSAAPVSATKPLLVQPSINGNDATPLPLDDEDEKKIEPSSSKTKPTPLFPPKIYFIADLLQDLQNQIDDEYWQNINAAVYVPIFNLMSTFQVHVDKNGIEKELFGQQDDKDKTKINFPSLLLIITNFKENLATGSCHGMDEKLIQKISASLDELSRRLVEYILQNYPNSEYVEACNKDAIKRADAIADASANISVAKTNIRNARLTQAGDCCKITGSFITCIPVTLANCFTLVFCCQWGNPGKGNNRLENKNYYPPYDCFHKGNACCDSRVTADNPWRFWSPMASIPALATDCSGQAIVKQNEAERINQNHAIIKKAPPVQQSMK